MAARTSVRPTRIAAHPTDPSLLLVTYDVVALRDDGGVTRLAADQEAPLHVDQVLRDELEALFEKLGRRMEVAAGLADSEEAATTEEGQAQDDDDMEL